MPDKKEFMLSDFDFLTDHVIIRKLEFRYNRNTGDKLFAKVYFTLPGGAHRDDTSLAVNIAGSNMISVMKKLYIWYHDFYLATNAFSRLTAETMDKT